MFESYAEVTKVNPRKKWTTLIAVGGQLALVAVLVAVPLLFPPPIPAPPPIETAIVAPPPPPLPPPPSGNHSAAAPKTPVRQFDPSKIAVPQNIPQQPTPIPAPVADTPPVIDDGVANGAPGGVVGGQIGGVLDGIIGSAPSAAPPPPPPPTPVATPSEIHIGGNVQAARLISAPQPEYPYAAKVANVHGDVTFNAVVGPDGRIMNLSLISGPPLLVSSATDAVKQWLYQPTILNGKAVSVDTQIVVHFQLG
jgi:protein TonB